VAYLVGYREFFSLRFEVAPGVFIPRPETETLVVESLAILKSRIEQGDTQPTILDLCTGSGAIAVSIAVNQPAARVTAIERSDAAFGYARKNAGSLKVEDRVTILQGNLFEPVSADSRFDVIVSNPPYVTTTDVATLSNDVKNYEPVEALDGGADGLDVVRRIAVESPRFLKPKGSLLLEISPEQTAEAAGILTAAGFQNVVVVKDLAGAARVVKGTLPS
jgi:release factor glutamine methyltransferase